MEQSPNNLDFLTGYKPRKGKRRIIRYLILSSLIGSLLGSIISTLITSLFSSPVTKKDSTLTKEDIIDILDNFYKNNHVDKKNAYPINIPKIHKDDITKQNINSNISRQKMGIAHKTMFNPIYNNKGKPLYLGSFNNIEVGQEEFVTHDVRLGFAPKFKITKDGVYELTFAKDLQFTIWDDARKWFYPNQNHQAYSTGIVATISDIGSPPNKSLYNGFISDLKTLNNYYMYKNGKITIIAPKDGLLHVGIVDINCNDNWVTTDGGRTRSKQFYMVLKRIR